MKLKDFENKFIQLFEKNYRIYLPKDLLKKQCTSPKSLIEYLGRTNFILRPKQIKNEQSWELNKKIYHRGVAWYMYLPIFVMNRVPSDIYRLRNPKMKFKKLANQNGYVLIKDKMEE